MRISLVSLGLAVAGGVALWAAAPLDEPGPTPPPPRAPASAEPLRAPDSRGGDEERTGPKAEIDALLAEARSDDRDRRHAAVRALKKLHRQGGVPLERLAAFSVLPPAAKNDDELAEWARSVLAEARPESLGLLPRILAACLGADKPVRNAVAATLRTLERVRAEDMPLVVRLFELEKTGYGLKRTLVSLMADLGADAAPAAPHLVEFVRDVLTSREEAENEAWAANMHISWDHVEIEVQRLLGSMGEAVVPLLAAHLREAFKDRPEDDLVRWDPASVYAGALAGAGREGVNVLMALLEDKDMRLRREAVAALGGVEGGAGLRTALVGALDDDDRLVRQWAAEALAGHGREAIPDLLRALTDPESNVRNAATSSLRRLEVEPSEAMPRFVEMLSSGDRIEVLHAAEAIASFGKAGVAALPEIIKRLATDDEWLRERLGAVVAGLSIHAPGALRGAYDRGDLPLRRGILRVIARMEAGRREALPLLETAIGSPDPVVRVQAAALLASHGRGHVLEILAAGLDSDDGSVRTAAAQGLAHLGELAVPLLPKILERIANGEDFHQTPSFMDTPSEETALDQAARRIGRFDLPRMLEYLDDERFDMSYAAETAFSRAGSRGLDFLAQAWASARAGQKQAMLELARITFLQRNLDDERRAAARRLAMRGFDSPDEALRLLAANALERDEDSFEMRLEALAELLEASDSEVVRSAAYRIRDLGPRAAPVEARLLAHRDHADDRVRRSVRLALEAIEDAE